MTALSDNETALAPASRLWLAHGIRLRMQLQDDLLATGHMQDIAPFGSELDFCIAATRDHRRQEARADG